MGLLEYFLIFNTLGSVRFTLFSVMAVSIIFSLFGMISNVVL
jgi:hypothetical protein